MLRSTWICRRCIRQGYRSVTDAPIILPRPTLQIRHQSNAATEQLASTTALTEDATFLSEPLLRRARQLSKEHKDLEKQLQDDFDSKTATKSGSLRPIYDALQEYEKAVENLTELKKLIRDPSPDLSALAAEDLPETVSSLTNITRHLTTTLVPRHPFAPYPAIIEIRPGTGGSEAAIFVNDLYRMYTSYCNLRNWPVSVLSHMRIVDSGGEGLTEVIFTVDQPGAYNILRHEAGVHRVQRVPATETKGRTHTSTTTVMVLPSFPDDASMDDDELAAVEMKDVRVDVMRARGAGGQHVNTTDSAVRMTHIPTGIVVSMQDSRSQIKNREKAMSVLRAKIADMRRREKEEEMLKLRRGAIKVGAGRSDKVRTYNYSQNRVTDHRAGWSSHDLPGVMVGEGLGALLEKVAEWDMGVQVENMMAQHDYEMSDKS